MSTEEFQEYMLLYDCAEAISECDEGGGATVRQAVEYLGSDGRMLRHWMRYLAELGYAEELPGRRYRLTAVGRMWLEQ